MSQRTLLDMVQDILSEMDSDDVNSIGDTVESMQIARILKTTYYNIIDGKDWDIFNSLFQLESSTDTNFPTHMTFPEDTINVKNLKFVRYNSRLVSDSYDKSKEVLYKAPFEFLKMCDGRHNDAANVQVVVDPSGVKFNILNDVHPTYYTSFDDSTLIFDSFHNTVDSTLMNSKTEVYGRKQPKWVVSDTFIPLLPVNAFSYLLAEAKSTSFLLRQTTNPKAEQHSVTQRRRMSQEASKLVRGIKGPDYGRRGKR